MKKILMILALPLIALCFSLIPATVSATNSSVNQACTGLAQLNDGTKCGTTSTSQVDSLALTIINILSYVIGIVAVIVIIVARFRFITSSGDTNTVSATR